MRKILLETFQFPEESIVTLVDKAGEIEPTRANIEKEIRRLADAAEPGDHCVILLSGSGDKLASEDKQPTLKGRAAAEVESAFLPSDAEGTPAKLKSKTESYANVIRGSEFFRLVKPIVDKKASLIPKRTWSRCGLAALSFPR